MTNSWHHNLLCSIAVLLTAISFNARSQESHANLSSGKWIGDWKSVRGSGNMEMAVDVKGDEIVGQVRSAGSPGCSVEWGRIAGVSKGDKVFARYNLGGRCGNVDIVFTIEPDGKVMNGSWSSEWPSNGTFRLSKQIALPAANAAGVSSDPAEKR